MVIKAQKGKILTNGTIYATEIKLGDWDSKDNYHEITQEEYEKIIEAESLENEALL